MVKKQIDQIEVKENAKMKKKFQLTKKKLILNQENILKSINYFKSKSIQSKGNIYLYLILKSEIDKAQAVRKLQRRLIGLKHAITGKTCVIDNDLTVKEQEHLLTIDNNLKVISNEEMKGKINQLKQNDININQLNYIYSMFLADNKFNTHYKEYSKEIDVLFYNKQPKEISSIDKMVEKVHNGATIIKKIKSNKVFKVKCASIDMEHQDIKENIQGIIYKAASYLLTYSQKHNRIEAIVLKTEDSIPLAIYGAIPSEFIDIVN